MSGDQAVPGKALTHSHHFPLLDGLRGIAALAVLSLHIVQLMDAPVLLPHAHLSVDFFFILSGFVVANAYEKKLLHSMTFTRFVKIRLVRLYPMIFAGGLLGTLVLLTRLL